MQLSGISGDYNRFEQKERGDPKTASIKPNREEKLGN